MQSYMYTLSMWGAGAGGMIWAVRFGADRLVGVIGGYAVPERWPKFGFADNAQ